MTTRHACFTLFNFDIIALKDLCTSLVEEGKIRYVVWQVEKAPTTDKKHVQGYVEFPKPKKITGIKTLFNDNTMHIEKRMGTRDQARAYCMKKDTQQEGPFEFGEWGAGGQGARNDAHGVLEMIKDGKRNKDIAEAYPGQVIRYAKGIEKLRSWVDPHPNEGLKKVIIMTGCTGCGKTRSAVEIAGGWDNIYMKDPGNTWFDNYDGQKVLLIDEFRCKVPLYNLLLWCDRRVGQVQCKGGYVTPKWDTVILTSCFPADEWYGNDEGKGHDTISQLKRRVIEGSGFWRHKCTVTRLRGYEVVGNTMPPP